MTNAAVSLDDLLETFYDSASVRDRAIAVFRGAEDRDAYSRLERALKDNANDRARNAAMEVYGALGSRSIPHLVALMNDADEEVRTFSGVMLGTMKDSRAVPALINALADPDMNVKHAAAEALGKIGDRRAVEPLVDALTTDMWLQFPAAIALGDIGDSRAVKPLIALLSMLGANVPAIQALGKLGSLAALEPLTSFLEDDESAIREWALQAVVETLTKNEAAGSLRPLSPKAEEALIASLRIDRPSVRKDAVMALGYFRVAKALSALRGFLTDEELREPARMALLRIEGASGSEPPGSDAE